MALTLYHNDISTCAQKVRLALSEKRLDWESRHLDLRKGDQRAPEYRRLNPKGIVPTLVDDDAVVVESSIILEYLDDAYPEPALKPVDPKARAGMRECVKLLDDKMHAMVGVLSFTIAFRHEYLALPDKGAAMLEATSDPLAKMAKQGMLQQGTQFSAIGQALGLFRSVFAQFDSRLAGREYLVGDYSLGDVAWTPYLHRLELLGLGFLLEDIPEVSRWYERLKARPSYSEAITNVEEPHRVALMREKAEEEREQLEYWRERLDAAA
jgi:glutathione S-transferase